jgi:hypothetical protein
MFRVLAWMDRSGRETGTVHAAGGLSVSEAIRRDGKKLVVVKIDPRSGTWRSLS